MWPFGTNVNLLFSGEHAARDAATLPQAAQRTLSLRPDEYLTEVAERLCDTERVVITGRGYSYATAREAALKLMETSYLSAHAFSGADLLHGPLAMIDQSVPVIAITSPGIGGDAMAPLLRRLSELDAPVLRVGHPDGLPIAADGIVEHLLPILEIMPLQRLAWRCALDRGGRPRPTPRVVQDHPHALRSGACSGGGGVSAPRVRRRRAAGSVALLPASCTAGCAVRCQPDHALGRCQDARLSAV